MHRVIDLFESERYGDIVQEFESDAPDGVPEQELIGVLVWTSRSYLQVGKVEPAVSLQERAEAIGSRIGYTDLAISVNRAAVDLARGRHEAVLLEVKAARAEPESKEEPWTSYLLWLEAAALVLTGRDSEAIPLLQAYVARHPSHTDAAVYLGTAYAEVGDERAVALLDDALRGSLDALHRPRARYCLARALLANGQPRRALRVLDEGALDPVEAELAARMDALRTAARHAAELGWRGRWLVLRRRVLARLGLGRHVANPRG